MRDAGPPPEDSGPPPEDAGPPPEDGGGDLCDGVDCVPLADECNDAACDPSTGECVVTPRPSGVACGAASGCILGGSCVDGECRGVPQPDGMACDDGDACTTGEVCTTGVCGGGAGTDCSGMDDTCNVGVCNPGTGACGRTPRMDGTGCNDGDRCTTGEVCTAGVCGGGAAPDCSGMDDPCNVGVCDPATGACGQTPRMDGTACDDGSLCTSSDVCTGGVCGGTAVTCAGMGDACNAAMCDPATGMCMLAPIADGTACDDADPCTSGDICSAGACGGTALDCSGMGDACNAGMCNPATGTCVAVPVMDGTSCDDGDLCTSVDVCAAGVCGGAAVDCSGMGTTCAPSTCDPATGACVPAGASASICATCAGGYCAQDGSCQPTVTMVTYDFEGGLPAGWTTSGDANWTTSGTMPHGGAMAAESGPISDSQDTSLFATFSYPVETSFSFWYRTSSESGYDYLIVSVDGTELGRWAGNTPWTQATFTLAPGSHTVEWRYEKDSIFSSGDDTVWIDDVTIGLSSSGYMAVSNISFEGSTSLPAELTSSGDASWTVDVSTAGAGTNSGRSGTITHSQTTNLHYTPTLSTDGRLSFMYRVSSESTYDFLELWVDGVMEDSWSGTVAWARYTVPLTAGVHNIEWRYTKDISVSSGSDAAWVDEIAIEVPAPPPTNLCAP